MSKNGGNCPQACAACKVQRKRCNGNCDLAPYFPINRFDEYLNAHRLFGLSNIVKMLNAVEPHLRREAAESILFEGNAKRIDPVHGSYGAVCHLKCAIDHFSCQLDTVKRHIALFRNLESLPQQQQQQAENKEHQGSSSSVVPPPPSSPWQYYVDAFNRLTASFDNDPIDMISKFKRDYNIPILELDENINPFFADRMMMDSSDDDENALAKPPAGNTSALSSSSSKANGKDNSGAGPSGPSKAKGKGIME